MGFVQFGEIKYPLELVTESYGFKGRVLYKYVSANDQGMLLDIARAEQLGYTFPRTGTLSVKSTVAACTIFKKSNNSNICEFL